MSVRVKADAETGFENSGISSTNVGRDELQVISFHPESNEEPKDSYNKTASWGKLESVLKLPESYTICSTLSWPNNHPVELFVHVFFTGHLTNFFEDEAFDVKITLNITVTLVLSNM